MVKIEIKNMDRLFSRLDNIAEVDLEPLMYKAVLAVEAQAKALVPVRNGALRASIHPEVKTEGDTIIGRVYTANEYAAFVEFGTGTTGQGSYPYPVPGVDLQYRQTPWVFPIESKDQDKPGFVTTSGFVARPYMLPALLLTRDRIMAMIENETPKLLHKAIGG
ncbi:MAG: HK97 gp10 family phage protein [Coriobacteriia bacterium]|nr:HK97 gp10 family phage protein [Coriobacteriia bacterium]